MKIYGIEISQEQQAAGLSVMADEFYAITVQRALEAAGVPQTAQVSGWSIQYISSRVADRLLQKKRRSGDIYYKAGRWVAK